MHLKAAFGLSERRACRIVGADRKMAENGGDKLVHGSGGISQPRAE